MPNCCLTHCRGKKSQLIRRLLTGSSSPVKVPKNVKELVWYKYIGEEKGAAQCYCCSVNRITMLSFEAGHVIAAAKGGRPIVENLRPVCSACNRSMGTQNLEDFKSCYFSK